MKKAREVLGHLQNAPKVLELKDIFDTKEDLRRSLLLVGHNAGYDEKILNRDFEHIFSVIDYELLAISNAECRYEISKGTALAFVWLSLVILYDWGSSGVNTKSKNTGNTPPVRNPAHADLVGKTNKISWKIDLQKILQFYEIILDIREPDLANTIISELAIKLKPIAKLESHYRPLTPQKIDKIKRSARDHLNKIKVARLKLKNLRRLDAWYPLWSRKRLGLPRRNFPK